LETRNTKLIKSQKGQPNKNKSNLSHKTVYYGKSKIMKIQTILFAILILTFNTQLFSQAQPVKSLAVEYHEFEWYEEQYNLWEKELKRNKRDGDAWINFYAAARMARFSAPDAEVRNEWYTKEYEVVKSMEKSIKGTFAYYRILTWYSQIWNAKDKEQEDEFISFVLKAHELDPLNSDIYPNLMNVYEIYRENPEKLEETAQMWKASGHHTPNLMALSYNALINTSKNAILITGGDNDTYPLWIAQKADDFRKDVNVWNIHLMSIKEYRNKKFKALDIPILEEENLTNEAILNHIIEHKGKQDLYFYSKGIIAKDTTIFDRLYNVGVIYKYAEESFNNNALVVDFFESKFLLDHLKYDFYESAYPEADKNRNRHYLSGLIILYQHYALIEDLVKAEKTRELIIEISQDLPYFDDIKQEIGLD